MTLFASREANITEPSPAWYPPTQSFNTPALRRQLGTSSETISLQERGILSLDSYSNVTIYPEYFADTSPYFIPLQKAISSYWESSYLPICQFCAPINWPATPKMTQAALLNDILRDTSHPPIAIHAYATLLYRMTYYNNLMTFEPTDNVASMQLIVSVLIPITSWGYCAISALLGMHLVSVALTIGLYVWSDGEGNLLGQAWCAVGQLGSEAEWAFRGEGRLDKEIGRLIKRKGIEGSRVGLGEDEVGRWRIESLGGGGLREGVIWDLVVCGSIVRGIKALRV
ncbi:hypothetical protein P280DRAFT_137570 [Massarina eburnea CBS 473.64]|uniref:Uncharacterized protein n=1 Tax=Massarina eburnea CBS 473.64 TaxID=1395130 RepID=A0A6A6RNF6_9PLEO|nr:hypothetical protein P280DRAFT_137570 [Massarina eburnea CBS 473.64]